jgi:hypothetical protein
MSISGISSGLTPALQGGGGRLFLPGAAEFADKLTIGQILKGRVLRQYDSNRYLVDFGGDSRVVDSAIPLSTGELLHGRVVGLGDRVELQRMPNQDLGDGARSTLPESATTSVAVSGSGDVLANVLARFQVNLSPADQATLMRAIRSATDGSAMTIAGVLLSKLGLTQSPDLLNAVYNMLVARRTSATEQAAINLQPLMQGAAGSVIPPTALVAQLGEMLRQTLEESIPQRTESNETPASTATSSPKLSISADAQSQGSATTTDSGTQNSEQLLGQWVLNAQTDGSVAHRTGTIPLLVGNRLMEVEVALFEQRRNADPKADTRHRQLIFRLNTETMGTVEISARLAGDRVRVHVVSEDGRAASSLSSESPALRAALGEAGWKVDEVVYETRSLGDRNAAASAVIDHVINQDSLNRVI